MGSFLIILFILGKERSFHQERAQPYIQDMLIRVIIIYIQVGSGFQDIGVITIFITGIRKSVSISLRTR